MQPITHRSQLYAAGHTRKNPEPAFGGVIIKTSPNGTPLALQVRQGNFPKASSGNLFSLRPLLDWIKKYREPVEPVTAESILDQYGGLGIDDGQSVRRIETIDRAIIQEVETACHLNRGDFKLPYFLWSELSKLFQALSFPDVNAGLDPEKIQGAREIINRLYDTQKLRAQPDGSLQIHFSQQA